MLIRTLVEINKIAAIFAVEIRFMSILPLLKRFEHCMDFGGGASNIDSYSRHGCMRICVAGAKSVNRAAVAAISVRFQIGGGG